MSNANAPVSFSNVSCYVTFSPDLENLQNYTGYFYAKDPVSEDEDFLTKGIPLSYEFASGLFTKSLNYWIVWYSGAYTVQTNTILYTQGRAQPPNHSGWLTNLTLGWYGPSVLVDGVSKIFELVSLSKDAETTHITIGKAW